MAVYVVAGSTQDYERWLRGPGTVFEHSEIHPLTNVRQFNVIRRTDAIILLNSWRARADWRQIYNRMLATGRTG